MYPLHIRVLFCLFCLLVTVQAGVAAQQGTDMAPTISSPQGQPLPLTEFERFILQHKGTERPFSGEYWNHSEPGNYHCRQCGTLLYRSEDKFASSCGWPSFDDTVPGAVKQLPDADGMRTEIVCSACGGHLGHVFTGEGLTPKDTRFCVNSASLTFTPAGQKMAAAGAAVPPLAGTAEAPGAGPTPKPTEETAYFAGGCFWGVESLFAAHTGVLSATSGYMGGTLPNPTYEDVSTGKTGHAETVAVVFDPARVSYEDLARLFFTIHDPTQKDRQGWDVGTQYRSALFYTNEEQRRTAEKLMEVLTRKGYVLTTELQPAGEFYPAEEYHQDFFTKHPDRAFCHAPVNRFK